MHIDTKRAQEKEPGYYALKNSYFTTWSRKKKRSAVRVRISRWMNGIVAVMKMVTMMGK